MSKEQTSAVMAKTLGLAQSELANYKSSKPTYTELESKLAASEEARKRVSSQYETVCNDLADTRLKLAAAEKLIEDSRKQEPVAYIYPAAYGSRASLCKNNKPADWGMGDDDSDWYEHPLYKQPPIPPELSEVMRERDELKRLLYAIHGK